MLLFGLCTVTYLADHLTQLPDLSALNKVLRTLDLSTNKLRGLPPSVCDLSSLKHLNLNGNRIGKNHLMDVSQAQNYMYSKLST